MKAPAIPDTPIYRASVMLSETIPLHVHLVKGERYSVWIDSGIKSMFPLLMETMLEADVSPDQLRFVLHTHSHHDHMGCNGQLRDETGCLIAANWTYAAWHADFEDHYQQFARPFPGLIPDTEELREEVLSILDHPVRLDVGLSEGVSFDLGGGTRLVALALPGHMLAEYGWWEIGSNTLILGDAITGIAWPIFHSHLDVAAYRSTLDKLQDFVANKKIRRIALAHFGDLSAGEFETLLGEARTYIDDVEATILRIAAQSDSVTLKELWEQTCRRHERSQDFRALNMVNAHVRDLEARGILRAKGDQRYVLR